MLWNSSTSHAVGRGHHDVKELRLVADGVAEHVALLLHALDQRQEIVRRYAQMVDRAPALALRRLIVDMEEARAEAQSQASATSGLFVPNDFSTKQVDKEAQRSGEIRREDVDVSCPDRLGINAE